MADPCCLNCGAALPASVRFCGACGQRADTRRLALTDIVRDLLQTFVNVERGPLAFAWALLTRPGGVAREYVEGKRRRHYGPFATLAVLVGVTALAVNVSGFPIMSQDGLSAGPTGLLERHFNVLLLLQLPLLGAVCAVVFRDARLRLPEHMVLVAYTLSVRAVVLALLVPLAYLTSTRAPSLMHLVVYWAAWYLYFGWAASQFYPGRRWLVALRGMLVAALEHALVFALLFAGDAAYEAIARRA